MLFSMARVRLRVVPNIYAYVDGNPIQYVDPARLIQFTETFGGGASVEAGAGTSEFGFGVRRAMTEGMEVD